MRILCRLSAFAVAACITGAAAVAGANDEGLDLAPAMRAAHSWLATVDAARYGESWESSATIFRETVPKLRWETSTQAVRGPLGVVIARKLRSANYARNLPGAPEGEYVVIQFATQFENRPLTVETVTPMREKDGSWKVSGYLMR